MKHLTFLLTIVLTFMLFAIAKDSEKDQNKFSQNLVVTLKSNHDALKQSAMQRVIQYSNKLNELRNKEIHLVEVTYVGTHEKAPY